MRPTIRLNFSCRFEGAIWNTVLDPDGVLLFEIRSQAEKQVSFSALDLKTGEFLWREVRFDEPWWISLDGAVAGIALFTFYTESSNPDRKGIFAYDITQKTISWWNNDFSLIKIGYRSIAGVASKFGVKEITLDVRSGEQTSEAPGELENKVMRPSQYTEDLPYFATVKTFLSNTFNLTPVVALEYLEYESLILISFYTGETELSNELLILTEEGKMLLHEKLDEHLKGIGLDTFFIYEGCVFFAKNRRELFSYKIV